MSFDQLLDKVVVAISVLWVQANSNALNDVRKVTRWVHAWVIPEQVAIGQAWKAFGEDGKLTDANTGGASGQVCAEPGVKYPQAAAITFAITGRRWFLQLADQTELFRCIAVVMPLGSPQRQHSVAGVTGL